VFIICPLVGVLGLEWYKKLTNRYERKIIAHPEWRCKHLGNVSVPSGMEVVDLIEDY
jgi:hypothetical protein